MYSENLEFYTKLVGLATAVVGLIAAFAGASKRRTQGTGALDIVRRSNLNTHDKDVIYAQLRRPLLAWASLGFVSLVIGGLLIWNLTSSLNKEVISKYLKKHDGQLFQYSSSGTFDIARVFPDKETVTNDSKLGDLINSANHEINFFSDQGSSVVQSFRDEIQEAIKRGVKARFVLLDPDFVQSGGYDDTLKILGHNQKYFMLKIRESMGTLAEIKQLAELDRNGYGGSIEVRVAKGPILYRMWVIDPNSPDGAIAHITVLQYAGKMAPPSFRTTKKGSQKLVRQLSSEFEQIWRMAKPSGATPRHQAADDPNGSKLLIGP